MVRPLSPEAGRPDLAGAEPDLSWPVEPASRRTRAVRAAVALACTGLGGWGLLGSMALVGLAPSQPGLRPLVGLLVLAAWGLYATLCLRWVMDRPGSARLRAAAIATGLAAQCLWPLGLPGPSLFGLDALGHALAVGLLLTAPCAGLAVHLLWRGLRWTPRGG